jgi:predicted small lipoprotein YifL
MKRLTALLVLSLLLAACGNRGDLVLPPPEPEQPAQDAQPQRN